MLLLLLQAYFTLNDMTTLDNNDNDNHNANNMDKHSNNNNSTTTINNHSSNNNNDNDNDNDNNNRTNTTTITAKHQTNNNKEFIKGDRRKRTSSASDFARDFLTNGFRPAPTRIINDCCTCFAIISTTYDS